MRYREHRYPCAKDVSVTYQGSNHTGTVVNVSPHGARLSGIAGLSPGDRLRLDPGPGCATREGEVRWTRGPLIGLRFDTPLDARALAMIRRTAGHRPPASRGTWNPRLRELR